MKSKSQAFFKALKNKTNIILAIVIVVLTITMLFFYF